MKLMLDDVNVHGSCFPWFNILFVCSNYPFSQWQWLLAWQLSEGTRMPLQILKAMQERNICSQGSKQNKITPSIIMLILTKSTKKSTLQASSLGQAKQEGECPTKLARRLHLIAKID